MPEKQVEKPFRSSIPEEKLTRARKMRKEGMSYQKIADDLGIAYSTLRYAISPGVRKRNKEWYEENKERNKESCRKWHKDHPGYSKEKSKEWRKNHPEYNKEYREENPEYSKEYYRNNKEHKKECSKEYYRKNKERIKERRKEWRKNNPEYMKKWREANPEYAKEHSKEWREDHPGYGEKWRKDNLAERNAHTAKRRALKRAATVGDLDEIKKIYRKARENPGICYICGKQIPDEFLGKGQVDHIFPASKGYPTASFNLAVVHARCNFRKGTRMPDGVDMHDRSVVERARQGCNLVLFWKLLKLILGLKTGRIGEVR